jgi:outer membrane protein assembly factor BamB
VGYRDELEAAHRRIAQLEEEQRRATGHTPAARVRRPSRARIALGVVIVASMLGAFFMLFARTHGVASAPVELRPASTTAAHGYFSAQWYPQSHVAPILADLNADGVDDIVGLYWSSGHEPQALHVVAVDGATFRAMWHTGPYPSQWSSERTHLVRAGERLLLTDTQSNAHVIDLRTGYELTRYALPDAPLGACASAGTGVRLRLDRPDAPWTWQSLDLESGARYEAPKTGRCVNDGEPEWCPDTKEQPCLVGDPPIAGTPYTFGSGQAFGNDCVAVLQGANDLLALGGWQAKDNKLRWTQPAELPLDVIHYPRQPQIDLRDGLVTVVYPTKAGAFRLFARNATTGALIWSVVVPDTAEGTTLMAMRVRDGRAYVVADSRVHVFDAATGKLLHTIATLALEEK